MLDALSQHYGFDLNSPFNQLPKEIQKVLLYGSGQDVIRFYLDRDGRRFFYSRPFEGILKQLDRRYKETNSNAVRMDLSRYINLQECPTCHGSRLKKESMAVTVEGKNISDLCRLCIKDCLAFFEKLSLSSQETLISERILKEIKERLKFLADVGIDYLSLERSSGSLSGGEGQRIRLATQIGSGLVGVLYVLD
jgi:excinuclease ABC subunit A